MSEAFIRRATPVDVQAVIRVMQSVYDEYGFALDEANDLHDLKDFSAVYDGNQGDFYVCVDGDSPVTRNVVGTVAIQQRSPEEAELYRLHLLPRYRGMGMGRRLIQMVLGWAREHDFAQVVLYSDVRFTVAHRLYNRMGFIQVGKRSTTNTNHPMEYQFRMQL